MATPKIFINMDGGLIQQILCDSPVEVIVADFDIEDLEEENITKFKDEVDEDSKAHIMVQEARTDGEGLVSLEPDVTQKLFKNIKKVLD